MADKYKGEVSITIDGVEHTLKCTFGARQRMLEVFNIKEDDFDDAVNNLDSSSMCDMIWCLLTPRDDNTPSIEELKEMYIPIAQAQMAIMQCMMLSLYGPNDTPLTDEETNLKEVSTSMPN